MNAKVLGDDGSGYYSWVAGGIIWAADNGARVISLSLAGGSPSDTLKNAVEYAWEKGCVLRRQVMTIMILLIILPITINVLL